jgi:hypothetical protein
VVYTAVGLLLTARREAAGLASRAPSGATPGAAVP